MFWDILIVSKVIYGNLCEKKARIIALPKSFRVFFVLLSIIPKKTAVSFWTDLRIDLSPYSLFGLSSLFHRISTNQFQ